MDRNLGVRRMPRRKILIVDDSTIVRMVETLVLTNAFYTLVSADNGEDALRTAASERPDLILMDVVMPKMDGLEACRRLREQDATRTTPIILVSTRGEPESVEKGFASGCTDYMTKPIDPRELLYKVRKHIGGADRARDVPERACLGRAAQRSDD
jgi:two-component system, OmpR family, alkaline phosphatase synthesis response regulator PhoP